MGTSRLPTKLTAASLAKYFEHPAGKVIGKSPSPYRESTGEYAGAAERREHRLTLAGEPLPLTLSEVVTPESYEDGLELINLHYDDDITTLDAFSELLVERGAFFTHYVH